MQTITSYKIKNELYQATRDGKLHAKREVYTLNDKIINQISAVEGVIDVDLNGVEESQEYDRVRMVLPYDKWQLNVTTCKGTFTAEVCVMWGDSERKTYFDYTCMFWKNEK